jgi:hypothetical protein
MVVVCINLHVGVALYFCFFLCVYVGMCLHIIVLSPKINKLSFKLLAEIYFSKIKFLSLLLEATNRHCRELHTDYVYLQLSNIPSPVKRLLFSCSVNVLCKPDCTVFHERNFAGCRKQSAKCKILSIDWRQF